MPNSLLLIHEDAVVDEDSEIVFAVAGEVGDNGFAGFGKIAATIAEGAFLEDLPAVGRDEFVVGVEDDEVEVVAGCLKKDKIFAAMVVQIAGDDIIEPGVFDGGFVAVKLGQFPDVAAEPEAAGGVETEKSNRIASIRYSVFSI